MLSFLSKLPGEELGTFVHLMLRGVVPQERLLSLAGLDNTSVSSDRSRSGRSPPQMEAEERRLTEAWQSAVADLILSSLTVDDMRHVAWERQVGFLYLLEQTVKLVGFGLTPYVPVFNETLGLLLSAAQNTQSTGRAASGTVDEDDVDADDMTGGDSDADEATSPYDDSGNASDEEAGGQQDIKADDMDVDAAASVQSSRVRTMCMKRLTGEWRCLM